MIREVLRMGDPRLLARCAPVERFGSPELAALLADMHDTMAHMNGAGLAAPQIGVSLRVVIFGVDGNPRYPEIEEVPQTVLINPEIQPLSEELEEGWEGCLSVPNMFGIVERHEKVTVEAYNENGKKFRRDGAGLLAEIFQHETDHLKGLLFIDTAKNVREVLPSQKNVAGEN